MSIPSERKNPSFIDALLPVVALIVMLGGSVYFFGNSSASGPNQIALLLASAVAIIIGVKNGFSWHDIEQAMVKGVSISLGAIFILLSVGALIGTWLLSGTVPSMIYYGLQLLNPDWFYAAACLICAIVALSIGSSWTTAATIGVALIGIATGLQLSISITAGAIISGAYFGDKISPLSETTNLAPAVAGSELFSHIRYMMWTTIPAITLALILFLILGFNETTLASTDSITELTTKLSQYYDINLLNLVPLLLLLTLAIKKVPAFPAVSIGAVFGGIWAIIFQPELIKLLAPSDLSGFSASIVVFWQSLFDGIQLTTDDSALNELLSGGGMSKMLTTIWLIICALIYGAILEYTGMLQVFVSKILASVKSTGGLIFSTVSTCLSINLIAADQYMSIVMPGRMYKSEFKKRSLNPLVLSRTLEDSGTITSPMIPWNTCGAFMFGVLTLSSYDYIFYCFFNLICPFIAIIYGYCDFKIRKLD